MWTMSAKELNNLKRRINAYNKTVRKWAESGEYAAVPFETTLAQELRYVSSKRRYTERMNQLGRALPSINRKAADVVTYHGFDIPRYMRNEVRNVVRAKNSEYAEMRKEFFPAWDEFTPQRRLAEQANKNYGGLFEEDYIDSGDSYQDLIDLEYPDLPLVAERYIEIWEDMNGDPDIPRIIRELAALDNDGFMLLMESPDIEKDIEYIYPSAKESFTGKHYTYKKSSAYKQSHSLRMEVAADYWREQYADYQNRRGYFK